MILPELTKLQIKYLVSFIVVTLFVFFAGCSEDPSSLGEDFLGSDKVKIVELDSFKDSLAQNSSYSQKTIALGTANKFLIGSKDGLAAHALLRFNLLLSSFYVELLKKDSVEVVSAIVNMYPTYQFGDSNAVFDFDAYKINSEWAPQSITKDSLGRIDIDSSINQAQTIRVTDSLVTFSLRNGLALEWLKAEAGVANNKEYGLYFKPSVLTKRIVGFQSFSTTSAKIAYITYIIRAKGQALNDTLKFNILSDTHVLVGSLPSVSSENIFVQSGVTYLSKVWFDLSKLPSNAAINSAVLTLTRDSVETLIGNSFTDAISAHYIKDSSQASFEYDGTFSVTLSRTGNKYSGSVISIISRLIRTANYGFAFTPFHQVEGVERFVLKGSSSSDFSVRPKLVIKYSVSQ